MLIHRTLVLQGSLLWVMLAVAAGCGDSPARPEAEAGATPQAINAGTPTGSSFGAVGALIYDWDGNGALDGFEQYCTGSLVSPTVFVVARHCVEGFPAEQLAVSFDSELLSGPLQLVLPEAVHYLPITVQHGVSWPESDLGVVILPAAGTQGITPLKLPSAGFLNTAVTNRPRVLAVGYGASNTVQQRPGLEWDGIRKVSSSPFLKLYPDYLYTKQGDTGGENNGVCYWDSGGPHFLESDPTTVVAVTTGGQDPYCRSVTYHYRLDTAEARAFLGQFVTLP